jgi:hypothetical protein
MRNWKNKKDPLASCQTNLFNSILYFPTGYTALLMLAAAGIFYVIY